MSGLNLSQLKTEIVRPTLKAIGLWSIAAENLLTGTALVESGGVYLRQLGSGPALGLWQMEPFTHDDCWQNFLNFPAHHSLTDALLAMQSHDDTPVNQLMSNLRYGCAMARVKYLRAPAPLPEATDAAALSAYHKRWYNTENGAADEHTNIPHFLEAIQS
ncbi:hypothetical protein GS501_04855 [Saccharibacter sp. 17.LH.SD]|uniref:hypothetical protein n=1 Tax=Saccharibacter sp. 17.LH.SD TaxID=2689393 RepID=UPI00136CE202|nr:hypothetical protein [Saccharibacter sp. 17.LH.SD]MXV44376.1 hypothetical protein [Saccharibacter sp. 17.LH.SD]